MKRRDPFDEIHISGQVYSIKKIKKLYELNNAVYPNMLDTAENMWICPKCGEFHKIYQIRDRYCSKCGQKIKWPKRKYTKINSREKESKCSERKSRKQKLNS